MVPLGGRPSYDGHVIASPLLCLSFRRYSWRTRSESGKSSILMCEHTEIASRQDSERPSPLDASWPFVPAPCKGPGWRSGTHDGWRGEPAAQLLAERVGLEIWWVSPSCLPEGGGRRVRRLGGETIPDSSAALALLGKMMSCLHFFPLFV